MRLSKLLTFVQEATLEADGEFADFGLIATRGAQPMLTFIEKAEYLEGLLSNPSVACVIAGRDLAASLTGRSLGVAISPTPRLTFFSLHHALLDETDFYGSNKMNDIHPSSSIHSTAIIAAKNVLIESDVQIGPYVTIGENVSIRSGTRIGPHTSIGGDGFECFRHGDKVINVRHAGGVSIGEGVTIHSNVCIDKGLFRNETKIGDYCSLDNFVHIAHNVDLGARTRVAAMAMIAGRCRIGADGWIGPNVLVSNGLTIGERCNLVMGSIVTQSVGDDKTVQWRIAF
jgi:UDP-3-O-[3-hydroxymyristoyl] glucosamine N-acyltransferase